MRTHLPSVVLLFFCIWQGAFAGEQLLDINSANALQLAERLPGIGPSKAAAIVQWRDKNGHFGNVEQLQEVKGIGPKTVEKLRSLIRIGTAAEARQSQLEYNEREHSVEADIHRIIDAARLAASAQSIQEIPPRKWFQRSLGEMLSAH